MEDHEQTELLRQKLLDEAYAGAFSGLGAMLLDAEEILSTTYREIPLPPPPR